jgi:hypothetical protein
MRAQPARLLRLSSSHLLLPCSKRAGDVLYSRDNDAEARQAKVLTKDEARRIALNIARLAELLGEADND